MWCYSKHNLVAVVVVEGIRRAVAGNHLVVDMVVEVGMALAVEEDNMVFLNMLGVVQPFRIVKFFEFVFIFSTCTNKRIIGVLKKLFLTKLI